MTTKVRVDSEPPIFTESKVVDESESESEVEDPLIRTKIDLPTELIMKLFSLATRVLLSLRSPDVYDPLQIFLKVTDSQRSSF